MRGPRKECESSIYHVMARGVGQQIIFEDKSDYERFIELLEEEFADEGDLMAWCLMTNHIHLLVRLDMTFLSQHLRNLLSRYAFYFNQRHGRSGHLFQGRFRSEPIETEEYFLTVVRYIHQNPQKAGISRTESYPWSSYKRYLKSPGMCTTKLALELLGGVEAFKEFHQAEEAAKCLDTAIGRVRVSDDEALALAQELLGENPAQRIACLSKELRDEALRDLKAAGLTSKQIQRITGVGRGVIERL